MTTTMKDLSPRGVHALQQRASSEPKNLKRLGFEVETELPDEALFEEFQKAFALPLSPSKEAMRVLFPSRRNLHVRECRVGH